MDTLTKLEVIIEVAAERYINHRINNDEYLSEFSNRDPEFKKLMQTAISMRETLNKTSEEIDQMLFKEIKSKVIK